MSSIYFEPPEQPADIRETALALNEALRRRGLPSRAPDGTPRVLVAGMAPGGVVVEMWTLRAALDELGAKVPELRASLDRQESFTRSVPQAAILLLLGEGGTWWCAAVTAFTPTTWEA